MPTFNNLHRKRSLPLAISILVLFLLASIGVGGLAPFAFSQVGLMPIPTFKEAGVQAETNFDIAAGLYTYRYTVSNPAGNTGRIWNVLVDVTTPLAVGFSDTSGLTIPLGPNLFPFERELAKLQPLALPAGTRVIPFGQQVPTGWNGGLRRDGTASFSSSGPAVRILPGQTLSGFALISRGMPTIRKMEVHPKWTYVVPDVHVTDDDEEVAAAQVKKAIIFHTSTLGPSAHTPGTLGHWNQLRDDLNQAIQLGWISDPALASALVDQLAAARQAFDAQNAKETKTRIQTLIQTITASTSTQRRREAFDLVLLNAQRLLASSSR